MERLKTIAIVLISFALTYVAVTGFGSEQGVDVQVVAVPQDLNNPEKHHKLQWTKLTDLLEHGYQVQATITVEHPYEVERSDGVMVPVPGGGPHTRIYLTK